MADAPLRPMLAQLRRLAGADEVSSCTDRQLVARFAAARDEAAFEALVRRHGPMVLGVCRRLLSEPADVEDAFQATFLILVRKIGGLSDPGRVGAWLHGVAFRTAREARARRAWRSGREQQVPQFPEPLAFEKEPDDWRSLLDEEVHRLPEKYRVAVVLCELQGQSRSEAARQLGVPEGTLSSRLARARGLLRERLTRRGLALSAAVLPEIVSAVPPDLATNTTRAALSFESTGAAAAALAEGVLKTMTASRLKITAALVLLTLGLLGVGLALATQPTRPVGPVPSLRAEPSAPAEEKAPAPTPRLSAKIVAPAEISADEEQLKGELVLTNTGDTPVRVCTLCSGGVGVYRGFPEKNHFQPDWWKSDRPSLEMSAERVVALAPGKSVSLPFALGRGHYLDRESVTLTGGYAVENKTFAEKLDLWRGEVDAKPVTLKVTPSEERRAREALLKLGANISMEPDTPAGWVVEVNATDNRITDEQLIHLRPFLRLRSLRLGTKVTDAGLEHLRGLEQLEELSLDSTAITDRGLECLRRLTKLHTLNLNYTAVGDRGLTHLRGLRGLESLRLFKTKITDAGLADVGRFGKLRFLDIGGTGVKGPGLRQLNGLDALETLYLGHAPITDESLVALRSLRKLRVLSLDATLVTDAGLAHLPPLGKLETVYLGHAKIKGDGLKHFAKLPRLRELDLTGTAVTDNSLAPLGEVRTLTTLNLTDTPITNAGLGHLRRLDALQELNVTRTKVTDAGLAHLRGLQQLRVLHAIETKVTKEGAADLRKAVPGVSVILEALSPYGLDRVP